MGKNVNKGKIGLAVFVFCIMSAYFWLAGAADVKAAVSESEFAAKIAELKKIYRDKEYWNGYNSCGYNGTGTLKCKCSPSCEPECTCRCGKFYIGSAYYGGQCFGFANKMGYLIFGSVPTSSWPEYKKVANYYAGDYVRIRNNRHSIFITKVSGDTITYVDCNNYGPCQVKWDRTISKSSLAGITTYVRRVKGNTLTGTSQPGQSQPTGYAPEGVVDNVSGGGNNITVSGWAFDRDDVSRPVDIHVYIGGPAGSGAEAHAITANKDRTDVGNVYGVGDYHGFRETIAVDTTGTQTLYFYAIGIGEGGNQLLGTKTVTIKKGPLGAIDSASGGIQSVRVTGWAYDPDEPNKAIPVHVYIGGPAGSGASCHVIDANQERKDLASLFGIGEYHGYGETIYTDLVGEQPLHFYAIDSEGLGTTYLGSRTVEIQPELEPEGYVDAAVGGTDSIMIGGWAYAPNDYTQSLDVHVYAGGPAGSGVLLGGVKANKERKDVGAGGKGDYHGFTDVIKTNLSGTQMLYFYAIGINGRTNPLIATKTVEITRGRAPEGSFDRAFGGEGSVRVTGWAFDRDAFTRSVALRVYIGGPAGSGASCYQILADKERTDVGDIHAGAGNYHGFDETIVTAKRGEQEIYIYAADLESNQGDTLLGHRAVTIQEAEMESGHTHRYTEKITKQATCVKEGEKQYVCACGDSYTEKTEKAPHNAVVEKERPATCVSIGMSEWSYCSECGFVLKPVEIMPKGGHKNTETRYQKEATCMEAGYTGDIYCVDCGIKLEAGTETGQTDHDWDKGVILIEPTYTEKGIKTFTCKICESSRVELIPVRTDSDETHTHNYAEETVTPATCVEDGEIRYSCICGDTYTEMVERFGHEWNDGIVTKEPTETKAGEKMFTCTICETKQTEQIPPIGTEPGDTETDDTEADDTETDDTEADDTETDDTEADDTEPDETHTHSYKKEIVKTAQCEKDGEMKFTCSCGDAYTEPIEQTGHSGAVESLRHSRLQRRME